MTREILKPYVGTRHLCQAILIDEIEPNKRNRYQEAGVFASIYLPKLDIELDHSVIEIPGKIKDRHDLMLYHKYEFTVEVSTYTTTKVINNIKALGTKYQLTNMSIAKFKEIDPTTPDKLSLYLTNRLIRFNTQERQSLEQHLLTLPEGQREALMERTTRRRQRRTLNKHHIIKTLY